MPEWYCLLPWNFNPQAMQAVIGCGLGKDQADAECRSSIVNICWNVAWRLSVSSSSFALTAEFCYFCASWRLHAWNKPWGHTRSGPRCHVDLNRDTQQTGAASNSELRKAARELRKAAQAKTTSGTSVWAVFKTPVAWWLWGILHHCTTQLYIYLHTHMCVYIYYMHTAYSIYKVYIYSIYIVYI